MFTLSLICQKGGAGKTTLAVHLAIEAARQGIRTLVLDLDGQASASKILDRRGDDPPDVATEHPARIEDTVARARGEGYQLLILDTAPHADQAALRAARVSDLALVPFRPSIIDIDAIQTSIDTCALAKVPALFVLNAVPAQGREIAEARIVIMHRGGRVAVTTLGERKAFRVGLTDGLGAQELDPRSKAAEEISALFKELNTSTVKQSNKRTRKAVGV